MRRILCSFTCFFIVLSGIATADFESDVIDLVNLERAAQGLHPLNYNYSLANAARDHSEDMGLQDYFSHTSLDGRTVPDGENIAAGQPTAENVVDSWMSSSGHRANILNPNFCDIGVGYAYVAGSTYGHYWTQDFGRKIGISVCPGISTYSITATAGTGGRVSPQGAVTVNQGSDITFTISPDSGYSVAEVMVDGSARDIATTYTFSNVSNNHTFEVNFATNQAPPSADAGLPRSVLEGATVTLDASRSSDPNDAIVAYKWAQISGPAAALSDENEPKPTFVAGPVTEDDAIVFELTVADSGGLSDSDTVEITVKENGIHDFSDDIVACRSITGRVLGFKTDSESSLVSLHPVDPDSEEISNHVGEPDSLIYGLIDFKIRVDSPGGSASLTIFLAQPVPENYTWFKYSRIDGWHDFSRNIEFNPARNQLRLTLVDGGTGDDDGEQNGMIEDPSGLGIAPPSGSTNTGGGSGGCFIDTLTTSLF